jgi:pimeloyl-ACP methyl ester carboxylesterase
MPKIKVNGVELYYEDSGGNGKESVVFSHELLLNSRMFDAQVAALSKSFRCITYDHRGQGNSEITSSGYDMETLYEDAAQLIQHLNAAPCHFVGVSMGGFVGMRLAARQPKLLKSLVLIETTADREPEQNVARYRLFNQAFRWFGPRWVTKPAMDMLFGRKFLSDPSHALQRDELNRQLASLSRSGIPRAVSGVINRHSVYEELSNIKVPTLILVGDQEIATMPEKSNRIAARIPNSRTVVIHGAGHSSTIEEPAMVNNILELFLKNLNNPKTST